MENKKKENKKSNENFELKINDKPKTNVKTEMDMK